MAQDAAMSEGTSSSVDVHWAIADRLGDGILLSPWRLSEGCKMNTEFEDWTWRSSNVWLSVQSTALGPGSLESTFEFEDSADFSHRLSGMSAVISCCKLRTFGNRTYLGGSLDTINASKDGGSSRRRKFCCSLLISNDIPESS